MQNMQQEFTSPLEEPIDADASVFSLLEDRVERLGDDPLLEYRSGRGWSTITAREFRDRVVALAKGLMARGIGRGDSVAIVSHTRWEAAL